MKINEGLVRNRWRTANMGKHDDDKRLASRLLRRQQARAPRPLQFSLKSLLLATTAIGILVWITQVFARNLSEPLSPFSHIWFFFLWLSVIAGAIFSTGAQWYLGGGAIGLAAASPILMMVYVNDIERVPLLTMWSALFVFATLANLGGGVWWFRNGRDGLATASLAAFGLSMSAVLVLLLVK